MADLTHQTDPLIRYKKILLPIGQPGEGTYRETRRAPLPSIPVVVEVQNRVKAVVADARVYPPFRVLRGDRSLTLELRERVATDYWREAWVGKGRTQALVSMLVPNSPVSITHCHSTISAVMSPAKHRERCLTSPAVVCHLVRWQVFRNLEKIDYCVATCAVETNREVATTRVLANRIVEDPLLPRCDFPRDPYLTVHVHSLRRTYAMGNGLTYVVGQGRRGWQGDSLGGG